MHWTPSPVDMAQPSGEGDMRFCAGSCRDTGFREGCCLPPTSPPRCQLPPQPRGGLTPRSSSLGWFLFSRFLSMRSDSSCLRTSGGVLQAALQARHDERGHVAAVPHGEAALQLQGADGKVSRNTLLLMSCAKSFRAFSTCCCPLPRNLGEGLAAWHQRPASSGFSPGWGSQLMMTPARRTLSLTLIATPPGEAGMPALCGLTSQWVERAGLHRGCYTSDCTKGSNTRSHPIRLAGFTPSPPPPLSCCTSLVKQTGKMDGKLS